MKHADANAWTSVLPVYAHLVFSVRYDGVSFELRLAAACEHTLGMYAANVFVSALYILYICSIRIFYIFLFFVFVYSIYMYLPRQA